MWHRGWATSLKKNREMAEMAKAQSSLPSLQNLDLDYSNLSKSFAGIEGIWSEKTLPLGSLYPRVSPDQ